ncbi:MAG: hypothetical protein NZ895_06780 [Archaeoglobaceae archaeon]|nr:hypothetical protein [Archaeoglobaceae archaeon]MCX8152243.1 hypothetical protein [Archaeoglobaceae archaeon]MDW8013921.1 hypothetical protein [Archaeoglobaceae archaeon]
METLKEILSPLILDESIPLITIHRMDGVVVFSEIKNRKILNLLDFLQKQVEVILNSLEEFEELEIKINKNYRLFVAPLTRTLVLSLLVHEEKSSMYKIRIDVLNVKKKFEEHVRVYLY